MNKAWEEFIKWFRETFPTALAVGAGVYNYMLIRLRKEEKAHDKTRLEKKLIQNELDIEREFADKSDRDAINSVISKHYKP